ncbi:DegT/DnrJ/EryC1/StrS family aminotransferase [Planktothrix agardhii]|uniref:DegT/DnrJ/EryC1/StrS family aminotransferase n=1 Tax=Planktothrix agardhii TaxID=1160 RepID=UPI00192A9DFA|nr:DegT/DnrJ/EryC1/StrS family aminotransferase [Planktothrix agardhii]MCB8782219.1 DegT/DnrJ/EryC1/StrS family aminotransferase [Planktothrix agardhii 1808]MCF3607046.1 DegT/DnrJ/EryC1/StrS family aminotransferase [Planktothrix agardhii 1033]MCB8751192.1 DegT/DnrJ/EryC1/StrS family aminotransferase [Planktothrix agardhii 1810]MCB8760054.1 DegT/DnrJ/EryC1/StrS family aminotransferase [Planktothrix agardhii 1813]MCB8764164.1 DegT/DnrJ/EryC1/StrS family aminotransferase [Planktothrix agardhii 18
MNTVPPLDLSLQYKTIQDEVSACVQAVLASGRYIGGSTVEAFEQDFGEYIGAQETIACNSGTDALFLALRALNIGPGDEVITTPFTFIATAEMISAVGATPVFVDIDATTFNLDIAQIPNAVTEKTKAIIPVHLFGQPVDMTRLMAVAKSHHLAVIEDCAQATGATWQGQKVGSIGDIGCFSFFPTKNLGACGDGGAVTTQDPAMAKAMRIIKEHGQSTRYSSDTIGINSRLDALQAAILRIKLRYLDTWNQQRHTLAQRYHQLLYPLSEIITPQEIPSGESVWNQYTIRVQGPLNSEIKSRDYLRNYLQEQGIGSMIYYPIPLHQQPVYQYLGYQANQFPIVERVCQEVLSLPLFPELSPEQQDQVITAIKEGLTQIPQL